ncbi:Uncharacterised protein [Vibrio cholerae]|uniref:Uncharacterized protein n=1 Tax=Vibrio cholerae TaxID=666 RepID=A0A656AQY3_VIBCL|nr:Uncharacterised protein [Vibrio cholerae]CSD27977.1 Uncharacterised protein [Vibrio cholerae]
MVFSSINSLERFSPSSFCASSKPSKRAAEGLAEIMQSFSTIIKPSGSSVVRSAYLLSDSSRERTKICFSEVSIAWNTRYCTRSLIMMGEREKCKLVSRSISLRVSSDSICSLLNARS